MSRSPLSIARILPAIALTAVACSGAKSDKAASGASAGAAGGKNFTIAMIAKSSTNPVFLSGQKGAEAAAAELTKQTGVNVKIDWLTPRMKTRPSRHSGLARP